MDNVMTSKEHEDHHKQEEGGVCKDSLREEFKLAFMAEFPELYDYPKVDFHLVWADGQWNRYRVNGWKSDNDNGVMVTGLIVFSRLVTVWQSDKGVQYDIEEC